MFLHRPGWRVVGLSIHYPLGTPRFRQQMLQAAAHMKPAATPHKVQHLCRTDISWKPDVSMQGL